MNSQQNATIRHRFGRLIESATHPGGSLVDPGSGSRPIGQNEGNHRRELLFPSGNGPCVHRPASRGDRSASAKTASRDQPLPSPMS